MNVSRINCLPEDGRLRTSCSKVGKIIEKNPSEWTGCWVLRLHAKGHCSLTSTLLRLEKLNIEKHLNILRHKILGEKMALLVSQTTSDEQVL